MKAGYRVLSRAEIEPDSKFREREFEEFIGIQQGVEKERCGDRHHGKPGAQLIDQHGLARSYFTREQKQSCPILNCLNELVEQ
ncbi:MAG TPA: hypothetical protein VJR23_16675 [Candidatus Acidoferrales bacterium]|nr:hypothetical protein [Candidatus Acidoferrales bacterium]